MTTRVIATHRAVGLQCRNKTREGLVINRIIAISGTLDGVIIEIALDW